MTRLQTQTRWGLGLVVLALAGFARPVAAQELTPCESDSDCDHGFSCEVTSSSGVACPDIACAPGEECDLPACEPVMPEETSSCVPVRDCETAADCIEGWLCEAGTTYDCGDGAESRPAPATDPACPEGQEDCKPVDPEPEPFDPPECAEIEIHTCVPPYELPCEAAADCGAGFTCEEALRGSCGGSSGSATPSGEPGAEPSSNPSDPGVPPDEQPADSCTTEPTGTFYCQLVETACEVDSDCAAGLTCQDNWNRPVCGGTAPSDPGDSAGSGGSSGGGSDPAEPAPPADGDQLIAPPPPDDGCPEDNTPAKVCAPPLYFTGYGYARDDSANTAGGALGTPESDGEATDGDGDGNQPPDADPQDPAAPEVNAGHDDASDMMESSSGCSATGHGRTSSGALFTMLAVLGLALRRRKA